MDMKKAVVAAALIGCGMTAQAYAGGDSSSRVMLGYSSDRPGMQVMFNYCSGDRVQRHDYRVKCEQPRYRHVPKGHAYGWHKNHKRQTAKVSCDRCIHHRQHSRDRRHG